MRKRLLLFTAGAAIALLGFFAFGYVHNREENEEGEENESESLLDRYAQEFEQLKDPALGTVPAERLLQANEYAKAAKRTAATNRTMALNWQERGPVYDFVGPSNGNSRANNEYTAGVVETFLVDLASDPTGNVVLSGSPSGGLWRCTNFLASPTPANWQAVNDFQANLAIASICQDPSSPNIMYLATGDGNTRDVRGFGVWKSTNFGLNWSILPSTTTYTTAFKILCDNSGNVYLGTGGGGLRRSADGGATWTVISPTNVSSVATNSTYVTDIEISSTGRLHAVFGYFGTKTQHYFTDNPATVTAASGWTASTGIRLSGVACSRTEIATQGNTLYAITANSSYNADSCYKSIDGGANWTLQNSSAYTTNLTNGQAWYALTLDINPDDPTDIIVGSVDAYRSTNSGITVSRATYWVGSTPPYVHADHHVMKWFKNGSENRIMIGSDGGMFLSRNGGSGSLSFVDRNQNLGVKQFYSCAISPTAGENFLFAGAQDNGCHQLKQAGLSFSTEVTGGDGAYVHINQQNPQIQFGSYVYNQYRRSVNGGTNWSSVNLSTSLGYFINPYDYDDALNIMYASNANTSTPNNQIRRWNDANTTSTSTVLTIDEMTRSGVAGNATAFKVSPYTAKRLFIGTSRGGLFRLDSAYNVASSADISSNITDITGTGFPVGGYLNCVNTGTSDNTLVATFTNYGISNVWVTTNGGTSWTAVDGNLPDMPVWWAVFVPGSDSKMIIATETGVYTTDALNGAATVWTAEASFPVVRTRMLKIRASDNTIVAATYGRGLWTATITGGCTLPVISAQPASLTVCPGSAANFSVTATGTGLTYQWRKGGVNISGATAATYAIASAAAADAGSYDVVVTNSCGSTTSNAVALTVSAGATITTQPSNQGACPGASVTFTVAATGTGLTYQWRKGGANISGATTNSLTLNNVSAADAATYDVVISSSSCGSPVTSTAVTLTLNAATAITTQPVSQTICAGAGATFTVTATGANLTYQWRKDGAAITGATSASYSATNAGSYDVIVTGTCGTVTSSAAILTVNATVITSLTASSSVCPGANASFSVAATGQGTLTYQWKKNGVNIPGATSSTYSIASTVVADAGDYTVTVTGTCGSVSSSPATLVVNTGGGCVTAVPNVDPDVSILVLMPNAVRQSTVLRIKVQRPMNVNWSVIDAAGKVAMTFTQKLATGQTDLPLRFERLPAGIYFLHGTTDKGVLGVLRFEKL